MEKLIVKEVSPYDIDFSGYFDDDGLKSISGENCACYIPGDKHHYGLNYDEYQEIQKQAYAILEGFEEVGSNYHSFKEVMEGYGIKYSSRKCHLLKEWAKNANTDHADSIADFLTITTGKEWNCRSFTGYAQGDFCEVVYCMAHYTEEHITEIGKLWLGCGTEFSIDNVYGYYVIDEIRWKEGDELRKALADLACCKPDELEIYLYDGDHRVADYKLMGETA